VAGDLRPESNAVIRGGNYAAHTRGLNTGSIGVALAAMAGAVEQPFSAGRYPILPVQLDAFIDLIAELSLTYKIPVTRRTILSHAEVAPTLGVWQRGKWDIAWLPGLTRVADPVQIGDRLRQMVVSKIETIGAPKKRWFA
jgi:N-acetyl-anhydromuramyl-L-alanine amidase AmpD